MPPVGRTLKAAILAGVIAGAAVAAFHLIVAEPVIERALRVEEEASRARGHTPATPLVSRPVQKVGLVAGLVLYGAVWGLLFGAAFVLAVPRLPAAPVASRGWLLAALAGWAVAVFPFLKYPANPPGVGDPGSIGYRQVLYLGFVALSIAGVVLAVALGRLLASRAVAPRRASWPLAVGAYGIGAVAAYALMPANPDPVRMPRDILWTFRAVSLAGLALFWAILGAVFGRLAAERA